LRATFFLVPFFAFFAGFFFAGFFFDFFFVAMMCPLEMAGVVARRRHGSKVRCRRVRRGGCGATRASGAAQPVRQAGPENW
jgi:hypothetical protein